MPTPVREQLLAAVTAAVSGEFARTVPVSERELPVTIVQDGGETATTSYDTTQIETEVVIARAEAATSGDLEAMRAQANTVLADLITDMYADETFGALADGLDFNGGTINTQLGKMVFAEANFTLRWHHLRGDPYTIDEP
jgi:hypothetical protein